MSEKGKKSNILKSIPPIIKHPYAIIIFMIIILTVTILSINFQFFGGKLPLGSSETKIESKYSDTVATWGQTTGVSYSASITYPPGTCLTPALNKKLNDTQDPRLYVYDNPLGIFKKPDINTVFDDMLSGLAYQSPESLNPVCYQPDEIYASYKTRTCQSKTRKCLSSFGNQINFGVSEKFALKGDLPPCGDFMGAISFNFQLNQGGFLNQNTKFLNVDLVECNSKGFDDINSNYPYYIQTGLFRINNDLALEDDEYLPRFSNQAYQGDIANQKFIIRRYSWGASANEWIPDQFGAFGSIILKAGNLYLTAKAYNNGIAGLSEIIPKNGESEFSGIYNLVQGTNSTARVGLSINSSSTTIDIIYNGKNYKNGEVSITQLDDTSKVVAEATINSLLNDYQLILKPVDGVSSNDETINWMFMPNIDFNPKKVPTKNKLRSIESSVNDLGGDPGTYIGIVNRYINFLNVISGVESEETSSTDTSPEDAIKNDTIWNYFKNNLPFPDNQDIVNKNDIFVELDNTDIDQGKDSKMTVQINTNDNADADDDSSSGKYNYFFDLGIIKNSTILKYPRYKYKALNNGICDLNINFSKSYGLKTAYNNTSGPTNNSDATFRNTLTVVKNIFLPNYDEVGQIIQDNQVNWLVQDAFEDVCVFEGEYFDSSKLGPGIKTARFTYGGASVTINKSKTSIYRPNQNGLLSNIDLNNINYTPSALKELGPTIVDLEKGVSVPGLTQGTSGKIIFYITPGVDQDGNDVGNIESYQIIEAGRNYVNDTITVFLGGIDGPSIKNISIKTKNITPTFEAVAVDANNNSNVVDYTNPPRNISSGACFSGLKVSGDSLTVDTNIDVVLPGNNYKPGQRVYINQIYQGKSYIYVPVNNIEGICPSVTQNGLVDPSWDPLTFSQNNLEYLAYLTVNDIESQSNLVGNPAPHNLKRKIPASVKNKPLSLSPMTYNFLDMPSNKGIYNPSPQQIAFLEPGGKYGKEYFRDNLGTNDPDNYVRLFKVGRIYTELNTLKTLQFLELNYTVIDSTDPTKIITEIDKQNQLDSTAQLKLGRFIPYSVFANPVFQQGQDEEVPNGDPNELYFNNNNVNIIAYGQKSVINIPIKQSMLETF